MNSKVLLSKAEALLLLARASKKRCQGGTYLLRIISNVISIGYDAGSARIKQLNPLISEHALLLSRSKTKKEFKELTINEHQEPLKEVWAWVISECHTLKPKDVVSRMRKYPMVVISEKEEDRLNKLGYRSKGKPKERFRAAGIKVKRRKIEW